ncbi:MAG TPA: hypothetical protein VGB77_04760 [Abditibacteriaceae bacterium]
MAQNEVQKAPRVAIFFEPGFSFYNATLFTSPRAIAGNLKAIGLEADLLDVEALSSVRFNVARYDVLVLTYGNTFPQAAFTNLQVFHHNRGASAGLGDHAEQKRPSGSLDQFLRLDAKLHGAHGYEGFAFNECG